MFVFSTPVLIRHPWQLKTIVLLHRCLRLAPLLDRQCWIVLVTRVKWSSLFCLNIGDKERRFNCVDNRPSPSWEKSRRSRASRVRSGLSFSTSSAPTQSSPTPSPSSGSSCRRSRRLSTLALTRRTTSRSAVDSGWGRCRRRRRRCWRTTTKATLARSPCRELQAWTGKSTFSRAILQCVFALRFAVSKFGAVSENT